MNLNNTVMIPAYGQGRWKRRSNARARNYIKQRKTGVVIGKRNEPIKTSTPSATSTKTKLENHREPIDIDYVLELEPDEPVSTTNATTGSTNATRTVKKPYTTRVAERAGRYVKSFGEKPTLAQKFASYSRAATREANIPGMSKATAILHRVGKNASKLKGKNALIGAGVAAGAAALGYGIHKLSQSSRSAKENEEVGRSSWMSPTTENVAQNNSTVVNNNTGGGSTTGNTKPVEKQQQKQQTQPVQEQQQNQQQNKEGIVLQEHAVTAPKGKQPTNKPANNPKKKPAGEVNVDDYDNVSQGTPNLDEKKYTEADLLSLLKLANAQQKNKQTMDAISNSITPEENYNSFRKNYKLQKSNTLRAKADDRYKRSKVWA